MLQSPHCLTTGLHVPHRMHGCALESPGLCSIRPSLTNTSAAVDAYGRSQLPNSCLGVKGWCKAVSNQGSAVR